MSEREHIPEGSVVITPTQQWEAMQGLRDEVKHLSAVVDPALSQVRVDIARNASRIDVEEIERKSEDAKISDRVHQQETAGYVTSTRMWTVAGVLAGVIVAAITVITYLQQSS